MNIVDAILLGGGIGRRFYEPHCVGSQVPKQFLLLRSAPVFIHAARSLMALRMKHGKLRQVLLVVPKPHLALAEKQLSLYFKSPPVPVRVVAGGDLRQDSSGIALEALAQSKPTPNRVIIHDACRPYISKKFMHQIEDALDDPSYSGWIPAIAMSDTVKLVRENRVIKGLDRNEIKRIQTPQIFDYHMIRSLAERARLIDNHIFTDDASLCEYFGVQVGVFDGDQHNVKITYDSDLKILHELMTNDKEAQ